MMLLIAGQRHWTSSSSRVPPNMSNCYCPNILQLSTFLGRKKKSLASIPMAISAFPKTPKEYNHSIWCQSNIRLDSFLYSLLLLILSFLTSNCNHCNIHVSFTSPIFPPSIKILNIHYNIFIFLVPFFSPSAAYIHPLHLNHLPRCHLASKGLFSSLHSSSPTRVHRVC